MINLDIHVAITLRRHVRRVIRHTEESLSRVDVAEDPELLKLLEETLDNAKETERLLTERIEKN